MMKKITILLFLSLICLTIISGQKYQPDTAIILEVNEQLWEPFKETYTQRDWQGFNALHTDDVLRISTWSGLKTGEEYKKANEQSFQSNTDFERTIDFRFEHRIHNDTTGYEVGYYKITYKKTGQEPRMFYARFHVRLKKENGHWKIAQDWDVDKINGRKVTAEDYGNPLLKGLK
jgi:ketosteroid isomerase-like protein